MNNCLVTKLKGVVDNDNLIKFGEIRINWSNSFDALFKISGSENKEVTISTLEGNYISTDGSNRVDKATVKRNPWDFHLLPGSYTVSIISKYNLTNLAIPGYDVIPELPYFDINNITSLDLDIYWIHGIEDIPSKFQDKVGSLGKFKLNNNSDFSNFSALRIVACEYDYSTGNVSGDFSTIFRTIPNSCTHIIVTSDYKITGTVESLFNALYNNGAGRTSGTLYIGANDTQITYNGNPFSSITATFTSSGWTVN